MGADQVRLPKVAAIFLTQMERSLWEGVYSEEMVSQFGSGFGE